MEFLQIETPYIGRCELRSPAEPWIHGKRKAPKKSELLKYSENQLSLGVLAIPSDIVNIV